MQLRPYKKSGFSLVEILIAVAVIGVAALGTMRAVDYNSKQTERNGVQVDFEQFIFGLDNFLGRKDVCEANLKALPLGSPVAILTDPSARDAASSTVFQEGGSYLDGKINIRSMSLIKLEEAVPALQIVFGRKDNAKDAGGYAYTRNIPLVHELSLAGDFIERCYQTQNAVIDLAEKLCANGNGIYNPDSKSCHFRGIGESLNCPAGQVIREITYDEATLKYSPRCAPILEEVKCPKSWIKSISETGRVVCLNSLSDLVDTSTSAFTAFNPQNCGLVLAANKIKLNCSSLPPTCVPVDGGWSDWVAGSCVAGVRTETSTCTNNPQANECGTPCSGTKTRTVPCQSSVCTNGEVKQGEQLSHVQNTNYCHMDGQTGDIFTFKRMICVNGQWEVGPGKCFSRHQNQCTNKPTPPSNTELQCNANGVENLMHPSYSQPMTGGNFDFKLFQCRGACFVKDTLISMMDGSFKKIQDVVVGDRLVDGQGKLVVVKKLLRRHYGGLIFGINNGVKFATTNHPFLTSEGWKSIDPKATNEESPYLKATMLEVGDILVTNQGQEKVKNLEFEGLQETVYNFELDGSHEYIANGYVVHNKVCED